MAPIQEAGQPIVIGGVIIPHQNQKVRQKVMIEKSKHGPSSCSSNVCFNVADISGLMWRESMLKREGFMRHNWVSWHIQMGTLFSILLWMLFLEL
jgi:hypothetical protein